MSVEGNAVRVAQPTAKDFDPLAVLVHSQDVTLVRSVGQALAPEGRSPIGNELGNVNGIPVDGVDHSIRPEGQIVAPVPHPALGLVKDFLLLELTVAIQITQPVQGSRIVGVGIKRSMGVKQSPAFLEGVLDPLDAYDTAGRRQAEAQQTLVLSANGNSALGSKAMLTQEFSSLPAERRSSTSKPGRVKKLAGSVPAFAFEARFHWV